MTDNPNPATGQEEFYSLITAAGRALEVQAKASNVPLKLSLMAVGDGGGAAYNPIGTEGALRGEKWRGNLNSLLPHPKNPAWLIAECILPDQEGGWWVREVGLLTEADVLYAIAKYPPTFKPVLASGAGKMLYVRMIFEVTNAASVQLQVDPSVVLATREALQVGLDAKLDNQGTAVAAGKLAAPRAISIGGGATAAPKPFDGSADLALDVTGVSMGMATGILAPAHGGTGLDWTPPGNYLVGNGAAAMTSITPDQVLIHIGGAPLESPAITGTPTAPTPAAGTANAQLATAAFVQAAMLRTTPPCAVAYFARSTPPVGWLRANGAVISIFTYPDLFNALYVGDAFNATASFGYCCTNPAAPTTSRSTRGGYIVLPDLRGEFLRGWDDGRGVDSGREFGSAQGDALQNITGSFGIRTLSNAMAITSPTTAPSGALSVTEGVGQPDARTTATLGTAANATVVSFSAANSPGVRTATETRPRNVALLACIKY